MLRTIRKENPELQHLLLELRRASKTHNAPIWGTVAERLARPRKQVNPINVGQLNRVAEASDTVVIPGKLLAEGRIAKPLTVAAFNYSAEARLKIHAAGGTATSIHELIKAHPTGKGVRLLG